MTEEDDDRTAVIDMSAVDAARASLEDESATHLFSRDGEIPERLNRPVVPSAGPNVPMAPAPTLPAKPSASEAPRSMKPPPTPEAPAAKAPPPPTIQPPPNRAGEGGRGTVSVTPPSAGRGLSLLKRLATPAGVTGLALVALLVYAGVTLFPTLFADAPPPLATLVLTTLPRDGASVEIDGEMTAERTPARIEGIQVGTEKTVTFKLKGFEPHTEVIRITASQMRGDLHEIEKRVFLKKSKGALSITSQPPGAEVYLDARYIGNTPHEEKNLARDTNELRLVLRKEGYRDYPAVLTWNDEVRLELDVALKRRGK